MPGIFDDQSITFQCPECSHKMEVKVGRLKNSPDVTCGGCGKTIHLDAKQFGENMANVEKQIDDLGKRLGGFKKT